MVNCYLQQTTTQVFRVQSINHWDKNACSFRCHNLPDFKVEQNTSAMLSKLEDVVVKTWCWAGVLAMDTISDTLLFCDTPTVKTSQPRDFNVSDAVLVLNEPRSWTPSVKIATDWWTDCTALVFVVLVIWSATATSAEVELLGPRFGKDIFSIAAWILNDDWLTSVELSNITWEDWPNDTTSRRLPPIPIEGCNDKAIRLQNILNLTAHILQMKFEGRSTITCWRCQITAYHKKYHSNNISGFEKRKLYIKLIDILSCNCSQVT